MTTIQLQHLLGYLGYAPGEIDGVFGGVTRQAVRLFQSDWGLTPDGIPGVKTAAALKQAVAEDRFRGKPSPAGFWKDIRYFRREEFRCGCGGKYCGGFPAEPSEGLVRLAETLREALGKPMHLSSGVRCPTHNKNVGGVANSRHLTGRAMDFRVPGMTAGELLARVKDQPGLHYAYAIDGSFVHMDVT